MLERAWGFESPLRHSTASSQDRSGFKRPSFCFDTLTEIRVEHPVLLGMQGDTDGPHCEVQNQGSLERRFLAVDQGARVSVYLPDTSCTLIADRG